MDYRQNSQFGVEYRSGADCYGLLGEVLTDYDDIFQSLAPRVTGRLAGTATGSIHRGRSGWEAKYSLPAENPNGGAKYGKFVEFGTRKMREQRNLKRALLFLEGNNT